MAAFPGKIQYRQTGTLLYRFLWAEVSSQGHHVLHKGTLWHTTYQSAISDGLQYMASYDFIADDDHATPILSVESLCQCQLLKCPFRDDIYCLENCTCPTPDSYILPRPAAIDGGGGCHKLVCHLPGTSTKVLVIRLSLELVTRHGTLHAFCIPRTDTYFYSKHKRIASAFLEFTRR